MKSKKKITGTLLILLLIAASATALPQNAAAAKFVVNSTDDAVDAAPGNGVCITAGGVCTLRAAIQEANAFAGPDKIVLKADTYILTLTGAAEDAAATGDLDITDSVTILGKGAAFTFVDGAHSDRVFHITGTAATIVKFVGLTIQDGVAATVGGGGILNAGATVMVSLCTVRNNVSFAQAGGGIFNINGTFTASSSLISQNSAYGIDTFALGGGIISSGPAAVLTITSSRIAGNSVSAVELAATGNDPPALGGGIASYLANSLTITGSKIMNNSAEAFGNAPYNSNGGGLFIFQTSAATITNTRVLNNMATGYLAEGGGVSVISSNATFSGCKVAGNAASGFLPVGGGFYLEGSSPVAVTIKDATRVTGNYAFLGGGILVNGTLVLTISPDSVVANNIENDIFP